MDESINFQVESWNDNHSRWDDLLTFAAKQGQTKWVTCQFEWHLASHVLVGLRKDQVIGFLRFTRQQIGLDAWCEPLFLNGKPLIEAKILAFAVDELERGKGYGRKLQDAAILSATTFGCYQLRSHSSGNNTVNHQLKLKMGFAFHPIERGEDKKGGYFIMPLQSMNSFFSKE